MLKPPKYLLTGHAAKMKGKHGIKRIIKALGYSWHGLCSAWEEVGFRQLVLFNLIAQPAACFLPFAFAIKLILMFITAMLLVIELINTAIEAAVDHTATDAHPLAKRAKDAASAAFYLALFLVIIVWIAALIDVY